MTQLTHSCCGHCSFQTIPMMDGYAAIVTRHERTGEHVLVFMLDGVAVSTPEIFTTTEDVERAIAEFRG